MGAGQSSSASKPKGRVEPPSKCKAEPPSKRFERAEKTGVLALQGAALQQIPQKVWALGSLRSLDLSSNKLVEISAAVGRLQSLTTLTLDRNRLSSLPPLPLRLETISICENRLTALPDQLGALTKLRRLLASHNALEQLPATIGGCEALTQLALDHNKLTKLPASFGSLAALVEASLAHNSFVSPLGGALGGLKRLKTIDLRGNAGIDELPAELLIETPLQTLEVDAKLLGKDGTLREMEGKGEYMARRKARIDKEIHGKSQGGNISFKG